MAVPDFQSFMLPLLKFAADCLEHNQRGGKRRTFPPFQYNRIRSKGDAPSERQTRFKSGSPLFFEHQVVELLVA